MQISFGKENLYLYPQLMRIEVGQIHPYLFALLRKKILSIFGTLIGELERWDHKDYWAHLIYEIPRELKTI